MVQCLLTEKCLWSEAEAGYYASTCWHEFPFYIIQTDRIGKRICAFILGKKLKNIVREGWKIWCGYKTAVIV